VSSWSVFEGEPQERKARLHADGEGSIRRRPADAFHSALQGIRAYGEDNDELITRVCGEVTT
jgi:hypothetical protein